MFKKLLLPLILCSCLLSGCGRDHLADLDPPSVIKSPRNAPCAPANDNTEEVSNIMNTKTGLPEEAETVLMNYLKCDSMDSLADCILPSSVADKMKDGTLQQANYFFAGFPCANFSDEKFSDLEPMSEQVAQNLGSFLAGSVSIQGVDADFTADEGYYILASAVYELDDGISSVKLRSTKVLALLKISGDRWVVMPTAADERNSMDIIQ